MKLPRRKRDYKTVNIKTDTWYELQYLGERYAEMLGEKEAIPVATLIAIMAKGGHAFADSMEKGEPYNFGSLFDEYKENQSGK